MVNVPLLEKVMAHIEAHPEEWNQDMWVTLPGSESAILAKLEGRTYCGTAYCFAGHVVHMAGYDFHDPEKGGHFVTVDGGARLTSEVAACELGLDPEDATDLFWASNTLEDLQRHVKRLVKGAKA